MIKTIKVINYLGDQLDLDLADPYKTGLWVESVTGIGGGKATINVTNLASDDGGLFNSARAETRNIVLTLGMLQVPGVTDTIEDARHRTYEFFPKKRWLTLIFVTDNREVYIEGYVESNEPDIFSDNETTQISIICPNPNFYKADGAKHKTFGGIDNLFEFPYSNEGIPDPEDTPVVNAIGNETIFGNIVKNAANVIEYEGEVETGITFYVHFLDSVTGLEFFNADTGESMRINDDAIAALTGAGLSANDELTICTVKGQKAAVLTRNGLSYNVMNALGRNPSWFQLYDGPNTFTFNAATGYEDIEFTIYYTPAYEGV